MFVRDDSKFCYVHGSADELPLAGLPAGAYTVEVTPSALRFKPWVARKDAYVPNDDKARRSIEREITSFFDPAIAVRLDEAGIVQKRGVLVYGPPGTGKTSLIMSFVDLMVANGAVVIIDCNADHMEPLLIPAIRRNDPKRPIVAIWDEFEAVARYSERELLKLLDGANSHGGLLSIGITNYLDKISARLRNRPSRFGLVVEVGMPSPEARATFLRAKYTNLNDGEVADLVALTNGRSMDDVKECGLLRLMGYDVDEIRDRLPAPGTAVAVADDDDNDDEE